MNNPTEGTLPVADGEPQSRLLDNAGLTEAAQEQFRKAVYIYRQHLLDEAAQLSAEFSAEHSMPEITASDVQRARVRIDLHGVTKKATSRTLYATQVLAYICAALSGFAINNIANPVYSIIFFTATMLGFSVAMYSRFFATTKYSSERSELTASTFVLKLRGLERDATLAAAAASDENLEDLTIARVLKNLARDGRWTNEDIEQFRQLLEIRNSIVHGGGSTRTPGELSAAVRKIDRLQEKLRT